MEMVEQLDATILSHLEEGDTDASELAQVAVSEPEELDEENKADAVEPTDLLKVYLREVHRNKLLNATEEKVLALRMQHGDKAARSAIIVANLRLVVKVAARYQNRGMPFLDLIEEGNIGLIKAVDRFKLSKECRFSTYGIWWIRQSIERALINQSRTIRLPVHIYNLIGKFAMARSELVRRLNRQPTLKEVAEHLDIDQSQAQKLMVAAQNCSSVDERIGFGSNHTLLGTLEEKEESPVEQIDNRDRFDLVSRALKTLSDKEREILTLRFGLYDTPPQTLDAIAKGYGVTRERIRQIEAEALRKLEISCLQQEDR